MEKNGEVFFKEFLLEKIKKHEEKLSAHKSSEYTLSARHKELSEKGDPKSKLVLEKLNSTRGNIEYHEGAYKAYNKTLSLYQEHYSLQS